MRIKPIIEEKASPEIYYLYGEIKAELQITFVPLLFQILANFPDYLLYLWERMEANIRSTPFEDAYPEIIGFTQSAMAEIYIPSNNMSELIGNLSPPEKKHLKETISALSAINAKLMILTIALRECIKGISVGAPKLTERVREPEKRGEAESIFEEFVKSAEKGMEANIPKEATKAARMLVPLTGSNAIVVSNYPKFFTFISGEMDLLLKSDEYLRRRVLLERLGLGIIDRLTYPLGSSYKEFLEYTQNKPGSDELVYLLSDAFPSKFPHLVFTSAVMERALEYKNTGLAVATAEKNLQKL